MSARTATSAQICPEALSEGELFGVSDVSGNSSGYWKNVCKYVLFKCMMCCRWIITRNSSVNNYTDEHPCTTLPNIHSCRHCHLTVFLSSTVLFLSLATEIFSKYFVAYYAAMYISTFRAVCVMILHLDLSVKH